MQIHRHRPRFFLQNVKESIRHGWYLILNFFSLLDCIFLPATKDASTLTSISIAMMFLDRLLRNVLQLEEQIMLEQQRRRQQAHQALSFLPSVSSFTNSNSDDEGGMMPVLLQRGIRDPNVILTICIGLVGLLVFLLPCFWLLSSDLMIYPNIHNIIRSPYSEAWLRVVFAAQDDLSTLLYTLVGLFCLEGVFLLSTSVICYVLVESTPSSLLATTIMTETSSGGNGSG